jgi:uracil-DNA glycosylase family 4
MNSSQKQYLTAMGLPTYEEIQTQPQSDAAITSSIGHLDWDALAEKVSHCRACNLHCTRTQTVFGVGSHQAEVMFIGEAPGAHEDRLGQPFVGRAGHLLDNMFKSLGLSREQVYIANILKCRPPNNRDPQPDEVNTCTPFLVQQIELLQPKCIVALGRIAAHYLLNTTTKLGDLRKQCFHYGEQQTPLFVTYHPAYLLRSPGDKRKSWEDLQAIHRFIQQEAT